MWALLLVIRARQLWACCELAFRGGVVFCWCATLLVSLSPHHMLLLFLCWASRLQKSQPRCWKYAQLHQHAQLHVYTSLWGVWDIIRMVVLSSIVQVCIAGDACPWRSAEHSQQLVELVCCVRQELSTHDAFGVGPACPAAPARESRFVRRRTSMEA